MGHAKDFAPKEGIKSASREVFAHMTFSLFPGTKLRSVITQIARDLALKELKRE